MAVTLRAIGMDTATQHTTRATFWALIRKRATRHLAALGAAITAIQLTRCARMRTKLSVAFLLTARGQDTAKRHSVTTHVVG